MILSSLPRDPLEMLIDEFLFAAGQTEGMLTVTERGTECMAPNSIAQYRRRVFEVDLMRRSILKMCKRLSADGRAPSDLSCSFSFSAPE